MAQLAALAVVGLAPSTWRLRHKPRRRVANPTPRHLRTGKKIPAEDIAQITALVADGRVQGLSPTQVYYRHLDDPKQRYLASERTFYRIASTLNGPGLAKRKTSAHLHRSRPQVAASAPGQVIVWDVTWIAGFYKGQKWPMYSFMDLYSRYIVGYTVQASESGRLASQLFEQIVKANQLQVNTANIMIVHSDNGGPMTSEQMQHTLASYHITQSLTRPSVSNDNAQMESCHRVLKYHRLVDQHRLPKTIDEATALFGEVIKTYNTIDYHSGIGFYTPYMVYQGTVSEVTQARLAKKQAHYLAHPDRYPRPPRVQLPPDKVVINQPKPDPRYATTDPTKNQETHTTN